MLTDDATTDKRTTAPAQTSILIVDDHAPTLMALDAALAPLGERVVAARSGEEAVQLTRDHDFAVILLDVTLQGIDGFETAAQIRKLERARRTPIIFVTGRDSSQAMAVAYEHGAVDYIQKPINVAALRSKIGVFVELHKVRDELKRAHAETESTLERIGSVLAAELDVDRLVQGLTDEATALCRAEFGAFFYNATKTSGERYMLYALSGVSREAFAGFPMPRKTAIFGPTFAGEGVVRIDDVTLDPRYGKNAPYHGMPEGHLPVRSYLALPVVSRTKEVLGGLFFGHSAAGIFSERDERLLTVVAAQAAIAIDNARLFQRSERLRVEQQASERRLQAILDSITEGIIVQASPTGLLVYANDAAARMCGFQSAAELLGASVADIVAKFELRTENGELVAPDDLASSRAVRLGRPIDLVMRLRNRATGQETWSIVSAAPITGADGTPELVVNVFRDITERKRAEEGQRFLSEASRVLGSSLDFTETLGAVARLAVPELADWAGVEMVQEDGTSQQLAVVHVDPAKIDLARQLREKYPPDPNSPSGVPNVLRTGRSELHQDISDELLASITVDAEHLRIARQLGLRSAIIAPIVTRRGTVGAITFVAAESGRRYTKADVARAEELAARAALAIENSTLYQGARIAIELRDDFLAIAGHELKTPLTALMLQLQHLTRRLGRDDIDSATVVSRLKGAEAHLERLRKLVEELLSVSRVTAGQLTLDRQETDLAEMVRELAIRYEPEFAKAGCALSIDASVETKGVWDRFRLEAVVTNLLMNAIKYGRAKPVAIAVAGDDGTALLTVTDHGIGVRPEDRQRIFDRFERAVSERNYGGLGLGLWISKQIVDAHGGHITLESTPGVLTSFVVSLPRRLTA
ncbi:MAG: hypothetical protein JWN44_658 [Myxococcales bacterium]|nr:hypothetical protein [Myxococcales bacterium]